MIYGNFNFFEFDEDTFLITNYAGRYSFLTKDEFHRFRTGKVLEKTKEDELVASFFLSKDDPEHFVRGYSAAIRNYRNYLFDGTGLHIFVLTSRCNLNCVYCQASANHSGTNMTYKIAEKSVNLALQSPKHNLSFEFQGGEPLENYDVLKHIVLYTESRASGKNIEFNLVSNLTILTDEMINFIKEHHINVSTSLDGHELIQNLNRPFPHKNGYSIWRENYDKLKRYTCRDYGAIQTTTKHSLPYYREIVDEYIENGFTKVFIRPLTPLGYATSKWERIGYSAEEFLEFYRNLFEYILMLAKKGVNISEGHACIFLDKILNLRAGGYTELTSPCGAGFGQLAYNYDGNIYSCDEGRMIAEMGDQTFKLGTVDTPYNKLFDNPICKTLAHASCLECLPQCESCAYSPYCGTCPVINYYDSGSVFLSSPNGYRCKIYKGILNLLFGKLKENDAETIRIFRCWVNYPTP